MTCLKTNPALIYMMGILIFEIAGMKDSLPIENLKASIEVLLKGWERFYVTHIFTEGLASTGNTRGDSNVMVIVS